MTATDTKLTEQEKALLALFRQLDGKCQNQMLKAAKALRVTAELRTRNPFAF